MIAGFKSNYGPALYRSASISLFSLYCIYYFVYFSGLSSVRALEIFLVPLSILFFLLYGRKLRCSIPTLFVLFFVLFTLLSDFIANIQGYSPGSYLSYREYLRYILFLPLGYLLLNSERRAWFLLGSFSLGFGLAPFVADDTINTLVNALQGQRVNHLFNPIFEGMMATLSIVFAVFLLGRLRCFKPGLTCLYFSVFFVFVFILISLFVLYSSQSRSAYLGLFLLAISISFFYLFRNQRCRLTVSAVLLFISFLVLLYIVRDPRTARELAWLSDLISGNLEEIPHTSWGIRMNMWIQGAIHAFERPFTGWGSQGGLLVLNESGLNEALNNRYWHLHSWYVEVLVRYGFVFFVIYFGFLAHIAYKAFFKEGFVDRYLFLLTLISLLFIVFSSAFNLLPIRSDVGKVYVLYLSVVVSIYFKIISSGGLSEN